MNSGFILSLMPGKISNDQWVRAAINKSCVGDAVDAVCCLLPRATLDDIIEELNGCMGPWNPLTL